VSPILGIWASAQQLAVNTAYESIATTTVGGGGSASVTFSSIPSTYTHLQIRGIANRTSGGDDNINLRVGNGSIDTGSNYSTHQMFGDGAGVTASGTANASIITAIPCSSASSSFGGFVIDILDYANVNKYKTVRILSGDDRNGSGYVILRSGNWRNTSAIDTISFIPNSGNISQYSSFALYGIKG
jgi:hypothetical protein